MYISLASNDSSTNPISLITGTVGWKAWILVVVVYKIGFSCLIGLGLGYAAKEALNFSRKYHLIDKESFLAFSLAFCALLSGLFNYLQANDLLGIFAAGLTLSWNHWFLYEIQDEKIQEVLDLLLNLSYFILFGALMPWHLYKYWSFENIPSDVEDTAAAIPLNVLLPFTISILLLRRLPVIYSMRKCIPSIISKKEACFVGWFGPIGVGALFYGQLMEGPSLLELSFRMNPFPDCFKTILLFVVFSSVIIHGFTVPLFNLTLRATMSITAVNVDLLALLPSPTSELLGSATSSETSSIVMKDENNFLLNYKVATDLDIHAIDYLSPPESMK